MALNLDHLILLIKFKETTERLSKLGSARMKIVLDLQSLGLVSVDYDGYINTSDKGINLLVDVESEFNERAYS